MNKEENSHDQLQRDELSGTELEEMWHNIHESVTDGKQSLSAEQTSDFNKRIDDQLEKVKPKEKTEEAVHSKFPTPVDLGKPVLSSDDLQKLIQELSGAETEELPVRKIIEKPIAVEPVKLPPAEETTKETLSKDPRIARLPSSWLPSKASPKVEKLVPVSPLLLPGKSALKGPFKIPKLNSSSPSPKSNSSDETPPKTHSKWKSIDIFKQSEEGNRSDSEKKVIQSNKKMTVPQRWDGSTSSKCFSLKSGDMVSTSTSALATESDEEMTAKKDEVDVNSAQKNDKVVEERLSKELRRLSENIVKDGAPLKSRRSCTLKRDYNRELSPTTDEDEQEKQAAKKRKNADTTKLAKEPLSSTKSKASSSLDPSHPPDAGKNMLRRPRTATVSEQKPETTTSSQRVTRRSNPMSIEKKQEDEAPSSKRLRSDQKVDKLEALSKSLNLKPCSINLPLVTAEELRLKNRTQKQVAMKSTNPLPKNSTLMLKSTPMQNKILKKGKAFKRAALRSRSFARSSKAKTDDDEWEDVDDDEEEAEDGDGSLNLESGNSVHSRLNYKNVCNIAFNYASSGTTYKCLIQGCIFQTNQDYTFIEHLQSKHLNVKWNGFCNECTETVLPCSEAGGHSIMSEFVHLISTHSMKAQTPDKNSSVKTVKPVLSEEKKSNDASLKAKQILQKTKHLALKLSNLKVVNEKQMQIKANEMPKTAMKSTAVNLDNHLIEKIDEILKKLLPDDELEGKDMKPKSENKVPSMQVSTQQTTSIVSNSLETPKTVKVGDIIGKVFPMSQLKNFKLTMAPGLANAKKITTPLQLKPVSMIKNVTPPEPESKIIHKDIVVKPSEILKTNPVQAIQREDSNYLEILRPWLRKITVKSQNAKQNLTTVFALSATYKCLAKDCSFFTSDDKTFNSHLTFHEKFTSIDKANFRSCAYCNFVGDELSESLIVHIKTVHCYDKYQCNYCFYRSRIDFNVLSHQNIYHKLKPRSILELPLPVACDFNQKLERVKVTRSDFVLPIKCALCPGNFYILKNFFTHVKTHSKPPYTKCMKCGERLTPQTLQKHLFVCHGFGLFQCVYCRFGTNTFEIISSHIANQHPSCYPFFCERSENPHGEKDTETDSALHLPNSLESTCLKIISQKVNPLFIKAAPVDLHRLSNFKNVGQLGRNIYVRGTVESKMDCEQDTQQLVNCPSTSLQKVSKYPNNVFVRQTPEAVPIKIPTKASSQTTSNLGSSALVSKINAQRIQHVMKHPASSASSSELGSPRASASPEPTSGLQIQSVFSLANDKFLIAQSNKIVMNLSFEAFKLKAQLENLTKATTLEHANLMLCEIQAIKSQNFQLVQDVFLTSLLTLMDEADGLKKNEIKTALILCINAVLKGSRIKAELPYRAVLKIILKQIFDFSSNAYLLKHSEELKIAVFDCFAIASAQLDYDAVEAFMVEDNKILLGQCIFVCKEAIAREKYSTLRKSAVEALMSIMQLHDKADFSDIVLRDQISKIVFLVLPQISAVLIKTCLEETLKGSSLVQISTKAFGRFLCLVFEDYEGKSSSSLTNHDFLSLVSNSKSIKEENASVLEPKNQSKEDYIKSLKKSDQWLLEAAQRLLPALERLKSLRGSEHQNIRMELAILSTNLLLKCLPNVQRFSSFLLENLVMFADDSDSTIKEHSKSTLKKMSDNFSELNQEIGELFVSHLTTMPRIVMIGDESEQIAGFTLLNSFIITMTAKGSLLGSLLHSPVMLEKFMNLMLSCCEIEVINELMFYENLASESLSDKFYHLEMPWKQFKNLKNELIVKKFNEICHNIGKSSSAQICVNHLLDNINSIEYLVLLIEILKCGNDLLLAKDQIEAIIEEFSNETYWTMNLQASKRIEKTTQPMNEEWFKDITLGLYESAIEVRLRNVSLKDDEDKVIELNLKSIKYNILCTCFVLELVATTSKILQVRFQRFLLKILHRVLEKAGSSNFLVRSAGIYAIESISSALGHTEVSQLIDVNSDYLLFNIQKMLRHNKANDAVLDMLSVIFKFSNSSMTAYIKDIVETSSEQMTGDQLMRNTLSYLKLFRLYVSSVRQWLTKSIGDSEKIEAETEDWQEFQDQCLRLLNNQCEFENEPCSIEDSPENDQENEETAMEKPEEIKEEIPEHIQLIVKVLTSSLQFFASIDPSEVILTHEIFIDSFSILHLYEDQFLPMVHQMWFPFTKQFQNKNLVVLQYSFRLLSLTARFAKSFIHKRSVDDVIPVLNKFLSQTSSAKISTANLTYTQEFKLQREILSDYGSLAVDLDLDDKDLDEIVDILLKFKRNSNELLVSACEKSLEVLRQHNPGLIYLKMLNSE